MDNAERLRRFWRMVDERSKPADEAVAIFKAVYLRDGADAAVEVAKLVIGAAAVLIAHEHGPDEARRILRHRRRSAGTGQLNPPGPVLPVDLHQNDFIV